MYNTEIIIGLKRKEHKFKQIITKLLDNHNLSLEDNSFLTKQGLKSI